jgi:glycosyltransferase involved in cell wall biosynthesis
MTPNAVDATVVITTKNRKDDLRKALTSAFQQEGRPHVLVIDDASTDGTGEMVRREFPAVQLERSEQSLGYIVQRNRAAALARTTFVVSIDDDAAFSTPLVVVQTIADFSDPRIGAVAIPFINVNQDYLLRQRAMDDRGVYVTAVYIGTAHALRRELFLRLGGYREFLFHQGEEEDFCIRLLQAGYVVRIGRSDPIHHFESPRRDLRRMSLYGRRNNVLFAWCNTPLLYLPAHLAMTSLNGLMMGAKRGLFFQMAHGLILGYSQIFHRWNERRPVSGRVYRLHRSLRRGDKAELREIEAGLNSSAAGDVGACG